MEVGGFNAPPTFPTFGPPPLNAVPQVLPPPAPRPKGGILAGGAGMLMAFCCLLGLIICLFIWIAILTGVIDWSHDDYATDNSVANADEKIAALQAQLTALAAQTAALADGLAECKADYNELNTENIDLNNRLQIVEDHVDDLVPAVEENEDGLLVLNEKVECLEDLKDDIDEIKDEHCDMEKAIEDHEQRIEDIEITLDAAEGCLPERTDDNVCTLQIGLFEHLGHVDVHGNMQIGNDGDIPNGEGNLFIKTFATAPEKRERAAATAAVAGSHNIVVGDDHTVGSFTGSIVSGSGHTVQANNAAVIGGQGNTVNSAGSGAAVIGGQGNTVSGEGSVAIAGSGASISGNRAATVGGYNLQASGPAAVAAGGDGNKADGLHSVVVGGQGNHARSTTQDTDCQFDLGSAIFGGQGNQVCGARVTTLSGFNNLAHTTGGGVGTRTTMVGGWENEVHGGDNILFLGGDHNKRTDEGTHWGLGFVLGGQDNVIRGGNQLHMVAARKNDITGDSTRALLIGTDKGGNVPWTPTSSRVYDCSWGGNIICTP